MSVLHVGPVFEPLHRVRVELAIVGFFEEERPLRGAAGLADWRLCGTLSRLIRAGRLSGARGDAALMSSGGGLRAPRVLVLGLGPESGFDGAARRSAVADALRRALMLRVRTAALPFQVGGDAAIEVALDAALGGAHDAWTSAADRPESASLALVSELDPGRTLEGALRKRIAALPADLRIELPPERPVERVPAGGRGARTGS